MHETEAEVLARIEATRDRMGDTIDQIGDRVNPDRLQAELKARARSEVRDAKENVKYKARSAMRDIEHGVNDAGRGIWDAIRENPIPAGMVGVGLAWLVANGASGSHDRHDTSYRYPREPLSYGGRYRGTADDYADTGYGNRYAPEAATGFATAPAFDMDDMDDLDEDRGMRDKAKEKAESAKHRASEAADDVKERAEHAMESTRHKASELGHRASESMGHARHKAGDAARQAGYRAQRVERRVEHAVQDNPLAAGAIAAALGLAAGMMIPESRREHQLFGETRDRLVENAERKVKSAGRKAKGVAREAASESAKKMVDGVMSGSGEGGSEREREAVTEPGR